jgi:broad specificity phosphatase PhoE
MRTGRIFNPVLTSIGIEQCAHLRETFDKMGKVTHIFASPLRRTLETAIHSFYPALDRGLKITAWPSLRETGDGPCNCGDSSADLAKKCKGWPVDLDLVHEGWEDETVKQHEIVETVKKVHLDLLALVHAVINGGVWYGKTYEPTDAGADMVFVSHGSLLHKVTGKLCL